MSDQPKKAMGFSVMDPDLQRRIASAGGKAAHVKGTAHQFTSEEAREAGRKGGLTRAANNAARRARNAAIELANREVQT